MSKIVLPIAELKPALTGLGKIIAKRATLPVLNHIKIERTGDGWIALTATDLDSFVTVRLEQPTDGNNAFSLLVPYDELLGITKNCEKTDNLLLSKDGSNALIEYAIGNQLAQAKVESLPVEEFPAIPRMKGEPVPVNETLRQAIHDALECASTDPTRRILNGACIDVSKPNAHYVVGTDGRHLFSSNSFNLPLKESLVIPSHKFIEWKEFNSDGEWQLKVSPAEKKEDPAYLQISSRRWRFITRQIEGNYPNWRQVVPDSEGSKTTLTLDPQTLEPLIKTIERMPCHDAVNQTIGIEWKNGNLNLLGKASKDTDWMKVPLEVKAMGKDITISLNRELLTKALSFGLNTVELIHPMSATRFSQNGRQMIVMPLRGDVRNPEPSAPKAEEPKPEASPTPTSTERKTMPANNGNGSHHNEPKEEKPTLDKALDQIEAIKGSYREAVKGLNELTDTLKAISKEQKGTEKELQTFRQTIRGLQSVKL
ncbi:MAG: DNA polymerase III subunit beta [Chthoniobacteraceae bacterium]